MKEYTLDLIKAFAKSEDIKSIPAIIVGMQEEDNVSDVISFKNCFRQLRNLAAHEPATIVSQLITNDNLMNTKIVFVGEVDGEGQEKKVTMDTIQFTAWMFEMYVKTRNLGYLSFWKHFMNIIYPYCKENQVSAGYEFNVETLGLLRAYGSWRDYRLEKHNEVKPINLLDPYITKNYSENPKLFWRLALPNMYVFIESFLTGELDIKSDKNINAYLTFFKARE